VRVATYGFIAGHDTSVLGDRPDRKYTPIVMRMLTDNLLDHTPDTPLTVCYAVGPSTKELIQEELEAETARLEYAVATGDWLHFLELELVRAEDVSFGAEQLLLVSSPERDQTLKLPDAAALKKWVAAVTAATPHCAHRGGMLDELEVDGRRMKAETSRMLNGQILDDMKALLAKDPAASLSGWAKTSEWATDTGGAKDASGAPIRAQNGVWRLLWQRAGGAATEEIEAPNNGPEEAATPAATPEPEPAAQPDAEPAPEAEVAAAAVAAAAVASEPGAEAASKLEPEPEPAPEPAPEPEPPAVAEQLVQKVPLFRAGAAAHPTFAARLGAGLDEGISPF
jgi:hypothetical protein